MIDTKALGQAIRQQINAILFCPDIQRFEVIIKELKTKMLKMTSFPHTPTLTSSPFLNVNPNVLSV